MDKDYLASSATQQILLTPALVTADGNGAGVDITPYKGECLIVANTLNIAGTNPNLTLIVQDSPDADVIGNVAFTGNGTGTLTELEGGPDCVADDAITITFSNATNAVVAGNVSGALGNATVGTKFHTAQVDFLLTAGSVAFSNGEVFTLDTDARVYSNVTSFPQATNGGSVKTVSINADETGRFLRVAKDIGGTNSPNYSVGVALYGLQK